ncbi:hypothetical protein KQX54_015419 [Cotesia glomerata]|uniref:Uncharacterized protein n=1 Tax=Cotesia glomerata TaxID=32391 RepID=A0AAV7IVY9_COTGL|nr:hypothetical protein KQX54_015419 [Cotesia glomerata]
MLHRQVKPRAAKKKSQLRKIENKSSRNVSSQIRRRLTACKCLRSDGEMPRASNPWKILEEEILECGWKEEEQPATSSQLPNSEVAQHDG